MRRRFSEKGFTLVELLIVIVIIGILAGVLIAVINPADQQNKAKDATTKATLNKIALSVKGNVSAYARVVDGAGLMRSLSNATPVALDCTESDTYCLFSVTGSTLPATCGADDEPNGSGTGQCVFAYWVPTINQGSFRLAAKSWGSDYIFVYESDTVSGTENTYSCTYSYRVDADDPETTTGCFKEN